MADGPTDAGQRAARQDAVRLALLGVMLAALGLRIIGLRFGLPALYDPDEGFFLITGLKLIKGHTLNPEWFGHPGTITIYSIAAVELIVLTWQRLIGTYPDAAAMGRALYQDPSSVVVPLRLLIVLCGVVGVGLTYRLGQRLFDTRTGLVAAGLLALNPLHISLSQIIRTDIQASLFMLLCLLFAARIVHEGRRRDYVFAAIFVGLGAATKWPAATVAAAIAGACLARCRTYPEEKGRQLINLLVAPPIALGTLLAVSPFLLIDLGIVLSNLAGEARPTHLGATGGSLLHNLGWYALNPVLGSFGVSGLIAILIGFGAMVRIRGAAAATLLTATGAFMLAISAQGLIWARWVVPALPFLAIAAAVGIWTISDAVRRYAPRLRSIAALGLCVLIFLPMGARVLATTRERRTDTRAIASAWAKRHLPAGSRVLVEYLAFDLLSEPWSFAFPAGRQGCADGRSGLQAEVGTTVVTRWRKGQPIVNIGTIDPTRLDRCRADYAIYVDYDRYRAERDRFPVETSVYETLARGGRQVREFRPVAGRIGGPVVRILELGPAFRPYHR